MSSLSWAAVSTPEKENFLLKLLRRVTGQTDTGSRRVVRVGSDIPRGWPVLFTLGEALFPLLGKALICKPRKASGGMIRKIKWDTWLLQLLNALSLPSIEAF